MIRRTWRTWAAFLWLAAVVIGCALTPSVSGPSAIGSASPAGTAAPPLPDLTPAGSPTPVPVPSGGAEQGVFRIELVQVDGGGRLPVVLTDLTGLVVGIEELPPDMVVMEEGVSIPDGAPTTLLYGWIGGACDLVTNVTFERAGAGFRLSATTKTTGDMCILIALSRGIGIQLSQPIDADTVVVGNR